MEIKAGYENETQISYEFGVGVSANIVDWSLSDSGGRTYTNDSGKFIRRRVGFTHENGLESRQHF